MLNLVIDNLDLLIILGDFFGKEYWIECRFVYLGGRVILVNNLQFYVDRRENVFFLGKFVLGSNLLRRLEFILQAKEVIGEYGECRGVIFNCIIIFCYRKIVSF